MGIAALLWLISPLSDFCKMLHRDPIPGLDMVISSLKIVQASGIIFFFFLIYSNFFGIAYSYTDSLTKIQKGQSNGLDPYINVYGSLKIWFQCFSTSLTQAIVLCEFKQQPGHDSKTGVPSKVSSVHMKIIQAEKQGSRSGWLLHLKFKLESLHLSRLQQFYSSFWG